MLLRVVKVIKNKFVFLLVFGIAKMVVYFTPLLLADLLTKYNYGIVEYALAGLGMLVAAGFSLGIPGAYPYFILRIKDYESEDAFSIHPLWLLFIFIINQILYYGFQLYDFRLYLAINFAFIIANQQFYSTKLKSRESILKAVLIDSGVYFILLLFIIASFLNLIEPTLSILNTFLLAYIFIYIIYSIFCFYNVNKIQILKKYQKILKFSSHLLISYILIFTITVAGRILTEYFFTVESVGVYGFYYRLAAVVVMIHQVISIMFFKKIYTFNPKILDNYFAVFFIGIYITSILVYFASPFVVPNFSNFYTSTFLENKKLFFILSSQMLMWIASALNSSILDREGLTKKNNPRFIVLILLGVTTLYILKNNLTLPLLTYVHFTIFYLTNLIQYYSLYQKNINFKKSFIVLTVVFISSTVALYFI